MGKVKIKKKSTLIDMTAMSDVTVLLLTFFMLTSTFLKKEPTVVYTPSSVSEEAIPTSNLVTVLVSAADKKDPNNIKGEGKIFLSFTGDSLISNENLRVLILDEAVKIWNKQHAKNTITLTDRERANFSKIQMMGTPFMNLKKALNMDPAKLEAEQTDLTNPNVGIPINDNNDPDGRLNDFQIWCQAINFVASDKRKEKIKDLGLDESTPEGRDKIRDLDILYNAVKQGSGITVKADKDTPFASINRVFDNLQTMRLNKFTLQTALKAETN